MQQLTDLIAVTDPIRLPSLVDVLKTYMTRQQIQQLDLNQDLVDQFWDQPHQHRTLNSLWHWLVQDNWSRAQHLLVRYHRPMAANQDFDPRSSYCWSDCLRELASYQTPCLEEFAEFALTKLLLVIRVSPPPVRYLVNLDSRDWPTVLLTKPDCQPAIAALLDDPRLVHPYCVFFPSADRVAFSKFHNTKYLNTWCSFWTPTTDKLQAAVSSTNQHSDGRKMMIDSNLDGEDYTTTDKLEEMIDSKLSTEQHTPTSLPTTANCPSTVDTMISESNSSGTDPEQDTPPELITWKTQERCCQILEQLTAQIFQRDSYPAWLINPTTGLALQLDAYNKELQIALEYQGEQHYIYPNCFHKNIGEFYNQLQRDQVKVERCCAHNVRLIVVPFFLANDEQQLKLFIQAKLTATRLETTNTK